MSALSDRREGIVDHAVIWAENVTIVDVGGDDYTHRSGSYNSTSCQRKIRCPTPAGGLFPSLPHGTVVMVEGLPVAWTDGEECSRFPWPQLGNVRCARSCVPNASHDSRFQTALSSVFITDNRFLNGCFPSGGFAIRTYTRVCVDRHMTAKRGAGTKYYSSRELRT